MTPAPASAVARGDCPNCTLPSRRSRSTPSLRARVFTRSATSCVSTTVGSVRAPRDTPARSETSMFATCPRARPQTRASWRRPSTRSVPRSCRRTRARWPKWFSTFAWAMCCVYDPRIRTSTCSVSRHPLRRSRLQRRPRSSVSVEIPGTKSRELLSAYFGYPAEGSGEASRIPGTVFVDSTRGPLAHRPPWLTFSPRGESGRPPRCPAITEAAAEAHPDSVLSAPAASSPGRGLHRLRFLPGRNAPRPFLCCPG